MVHYLSTMRLADAGKRTLLPIGKQLHESHMPMDIDRSGKPIRWELCKQSAPQSEQGAEGNHWNDADLETKQGQSRC
jgi:hypothetical protein